VRLPKKITSVAEAQDVRHVRLERRPKTQLSNDDSTAWAVSYSDMLMVLMSFFVLFFSFEESKRQSIVSQIAMDMHISTEKEVAKDAAAGGGGKGSYPGLGAGNSLIPPAPLGVVAKGGPFTITDLMTSFEQASYKVSSNDKKDVLVVNLSDEIFGSRQFDLTGPVKKELNKALELLTPYKDQIKIVFIGHSDSDALTKTNRFMTNNIELSSLRASRALEYAAELGFDPAFLTVEAAASTLRNTRSVSIRIQQRR
jgi:flagellar motor protein MotB